MHYLPRQFEQGVVDGGVALYREPFDLLDHIGLYGEVVIVEVDVFEGVVETCVYAVAAAATTHGGFLFLGHMITMDETRPFRCSSIVVVRG